ncbi:aconitate hydratase [Thermanaerothrix daxensis]|uniref:Aconitate hydratase n=1 Tax=Thermanaerothrix daxensis TaxID=869279 RepID=A0A0P6YM42_9CHLR|nr:aconitate hydratase AcnA [Thermanaerothrix daxensis]KPL83769.1 aconitate hydratase [Thermanaerothrix daxensis]
MTTLPQPAILTLEDRSYRYYPLEALLSPDRLVRLPFVIRIFLEGVVRQAAQGRAGLEDVEHLVAWQPQAEQRPSLPFFPGRVVMQDFTGVPVLNDLAGMRAAVARLGGDPAMVNPQVPVDLVIDHSVQVDYYGMPDAFRLNAEKEFERNRERYEFLHWCQRAFKNLRIVPPASGIVHQVNLEYLARGVLTVEEADGLPMAFPDTLVGTDSHTTMINGLGVVGWGVGGIEAIAAMLGEPIEIVAPDVIGFRLSGKLPEGTTPTDLTLTIVQMLRRFGVVDKVVEFFGPGLDHLTLADRAMIANMAPESGATMLYFPVDAQTLDYLRFSGRPEALVRLVEAYYRAQHLFRTAETPTPTYTAVLELDMGQVEPSLAGPRRPQDRVALGNVPASFRQALTAPRTANGFGVPEAEQAAEVAVNLDGQTMTLRHGSVVIAAITSCTNTSNPYVMVAAGLLAKKAVERGLRTPPYVKTSLAPGSRVVVDYLAAAGLLKPLEALGFHLVGFGCTTCIGNAGPLPEPIVEAIKAQNLVAVAVLSGNRNFEGRISPHTRANYLASPPLVVAYALAGEIGRDLTREPLGYDPQGQPVYLRDLWPSSQEVFETIQRAITPELFARDYADLYAGNPLWNAIHSGEGLLYTWDARSTYLQEPPFYEVPQEATWVADIRGARVLALLGDSVTTDHISPAGTIPVNTPAGQYLIAQGVPPSEFNSYGSRRGNHQVMVRGTFANIRLKNLLVPGVEGGYTRHFPEGETMTIYEAAMRYQAEGVPLLILAGKEYGTGSSRDWAAKGTRLLGVRAVIAESFERIHRANLAGMGVLPLQFLPGQNAQSLGLSGEEVYDLRGLAGNLFPGARLEVRAQRADGSEVRFEVILRLDTLNEVRYYRQGGLLPAVLNHLLGQRAAANP